MTRTEKIVLVSSLILSFVLTQMVFFGGMGIGVFITLGVFMGALFCIAKYCEPEIKPRLNIFLVLIVLCGMTFVLFDHGLKFFNVLFLLALLCAYSTQLFGLNRTQTFLPSWVLETMGHFFSLPFMNFDAPIVLLKKEAVEGGKGKTLMVGKILIGLAISAPILAVVTVLLAGSDAAFSGFLEWVAGQIQFNIGDIILRVIVMCITFFFVTGYFYTLAHNSKEKPYALADSGEEEEKNRKGLDFTILSTVVTLICLLYLTFCFSQFAYFISAFKGILPEEFTFAEYARRGFFETLPITGFNLILLGILGISLKRQEPKKKAYLTGMFGFIMIFALFMVVSALSKMGMYMKTYGLTIRRIYVAWFLILCALLIVFVFISAFKHRFKLIKVSFITFSVMYMGLNYSNVDYIVAKQNLMIYAKSSGSLNGIGSLSPMALLPLADYTLGNLPQNSSDLKRDEKLEKAIHRLERKLEDKKWQAFTVEDYLARKALKTIREQE